MFKNFKMKTKLILAAIILGAIVYSCVEREEQTVEEETYLKEEKTINKQESESKAKTSKATDSVRTKDLLDGTNQTTLDPTADPSDTTGETVNPGSLGTPPTRP
jgi:hypothetical protein